MFKVKSSHCSFFQINWIYNHIPNKETFFPLVLLFVVFVSTYKIIVSVLASTVRNNTPFIIGVKQILLFA